MKRQIIAMIVTAATLAGCASGSAPNPALVPRVYTPRFQTISFNFMEKYRLTHDYLIGPGIKQCRYIVRQSTMRMEEGSAVYHNSNYGEFIERDDKPYQYGTWQGQPKLFPMENFLVGSSRVSSLGGVKNYHYWDFSPLCTDWVGSHNYIFEIHKRSSLSIEQSIQAKKDLLQDHWSSVSRWEPEQKGKRMGNTWTVFKWWNRAIYLADASEDWYLPIGDGTYYIYAAFAYKSAEPKVEPEQYARARAAFDHIIDSVKIEPLH